MNVLFKSFLQLTNFSAYGSGRGSLHWTPKEGGGWKGAEADSALAPASTVPSGKTSLSPYEKKLLHINFYFFLETLPPHFIFPSPQHKEYIDHQIWIFFFFCSNKKYSINIQTITNPLDCSLFYHLQII